VQPFSPRDQVTMVQAILRYVGPAPQRTNALLSHGDLVLDHDKCKVTLHGQPVALTRSEYTLLQALMTAPGRVFSRQELINHLYPGGGAVVERVIDVHISKLRRKLEADPTQPHYIVTVRSVGYYFADGEA
jgi:DNA-binding response OmpR family regulator